MLLLAGIQLWFFVLLLEVLRKWYVLMWNSLSDRKPEWNVLFDLYIHDSLIISTTLRHLLHQRPSFCIYSSCMSGSRSFRNSVTFTFNFSINAKLFPSFPKTSFGFMNMWKSPDVKYELYREWSMNLILFGINVSFCWRLGEKRYHARVRQTAVLTGILNSHL